MTTDGAPASTVGAAAPSAARPANPLASHRPAEGRGAAGADGREQRRQSSMAGWLAVLPYVLLLVAFGVIPIVFAIRSAVLVTPVFGDEYFSLTRNFHDVLVDYRFLPALRHVGLYLVIWLPLMLFIVVALALIMDAHRSKLGAVTRFIAYVPGAVTGAAAAFLGLFVCSPPVSPVAPLLRSFFGDESIILNNNTLVTVLTVMAIAIGAGGWIVVLYGALVSLPPEVLEAATIDGAGSWQSSLRIKLPMIRKYLAFIVIVSFANGVQVFVEPEVLTSGAPTQISNSWAVNQLVYRYATGEGNFGRAAALSLMLLAVCVVAAVVVILTTRFYQSDER